MFGINVFYSIGASKDQSYKLIEYAATKMSDSENWWREVGCLIGHHDDDIMNGTSTLIEALNKIWWGLSTLENYVIEYGDGELTQQEIDKGRSELPLTSDELADLRRIME